MKHNTTKLLPYFIGGRIDEMRACLPTCIAVAGTEEALVARLALWARMVLTALPLYLLDE